MKTSVTAIRLFVLAALLTGSTASFGQEDNWWRKLFRKDTVEEQVKMTEPGAQDQPPAIRDSVKEERVDDLSGLPTAASGLPGRVMVSAPDGLAALDSAYRASPPLMKGYRIQVYFGDLQAARSARMVFMADIEEMPCYLVQNPPNFAVQVGDYRTQLDAFRELQQLKALYPAATVVPSSIEPPALRKRE